MNHPTNKPISFLYTVILFCLYPFVANAEQQLPLDKILQARTIDHQEQKLFEKPVTKNRFYFKGQAKRDGNYCIEIKKVNFEDITKLSIAKKVEFQSEVINQCIYNDQIGDLLNEIINYYIEQGYTNARAYFKEYNTKEKILTLKISEGVINSIILNDIKENNGSKNQDQKILGPIKNNFSQKSQLFFAFPTKKGKIFDIEDMEQGISQMNRLRSNNVVVDSRPATIDGASDIIVNNYKNPNSFEAGINYDNNGSQSTGIHNISYNINQDNLLKMDDNIGFSKIKSARSNTDIFNISQPFGYYTVSYSNSKNNYKSLTDNGVTVLGTSNSQDINLNRLIFRNKKHEINLTTNLNFRNQTRIDAGITTIPSQRLSTGRIGFDYTARLKDLTIYTGLTYSKGLRIHNAINDNDLVLDKDSAKAQFQKISYNLNIYKPINEYLNYVLQANGQYSPDGLYSSELIYVGGSKSTVRGLQYDGINGSKGGYIRNDLSVNLAKIIDNNNIKTSNKATNYGLAILKSTTPYIFYDSGYAKQIGKEGELVKTEYISGAGFGFKYNGKYIIGEFSYAKNLRSPNRLIKSNHYKKSAVYFGISAKYWLF